MEELVARRIMNQAELDAADAELAAVKRSIGIIQAEFSNKDKRHANGRRYSNTEFWAWKSAATTKLERLLVAHRELQSAIRDYNRKTFVSMDASQLSPVMRQLISDASLLLHELVDEGVDLSQGERSVLQRLDEALNISSAG